MENEKRLTVKEWAEMDKPREKMLHHGKKMLSNAELLAILLRSGRADTDVVSMAQQIMQLADNSLVSLSRMEAAELMRIKGVAEAKATTILAAMELGLRLSSESRKASNNVISDSHSLFHYLSDRLVDQPVEEFWAVYLSTRNHVVGERRISVGGITQTVVDIRLIIKGALECNAVSMAIAHNHPSGRLVPSKEDIRLTERIAEAGRVMGIRLQDHLIIGYNEEGESSFYSFTDEGRI